jgi:hypothetical protein
MIGGKLEGRGHLPLLGAAAHQGGVAPGAYGEREGIEQDGLAGAGLAGESRQPGAERQIELVDENDIADRQSG